MRNVKFTFKSRLEQQDHEQLFCSRQMEDAIMMKVLIVDDETIIREGLKFFINWNSLDFTICGEADDGDEALKLILELEPDLVLLDIRMPNLLGTEIVQLAREQNYKGHFIILSGYSDFKYAQTAMRYGVDYYLIKPIDEEELLQAVTAVKKTLLEEKQASLSINQYREKAKYTILRDILLNSGSTNAIRLDELNLTANIYQVVMYESYNQDAFNMTYNFADLLRVTNQGNNSFEYIKIHQKNIILLKGDFATKRLHDFIRHYSNNPQKGSPLDSLFISYGREVNRPEDIHYSYEDALELLNRRFFCEQNQHTICYEQLPEHSTGVDETDTLDAGRYCELLCSYIQSHNRYTLNDLLKSLADEMYHSRKEISDIKLFLTDIYLQIKQTIQNRYSTISLPFPTNSWIIDYIESRYYLYEIIQFFTEQFEMMMNAIGSSSGDGIWEDIIHYIHHNYQENLKLESIAPIFGYNSSYLGKIFSERVGENFNSYLNHIRINHSKELLLQKNRKVYEVAEKVGYKNVDYFHKQFRKYVGESPAEFRSRNLGLF